MQPELKVGETLQNVHLEGRNQQMDKRKCGNKRFLWGFRWSHLNFASWECFMEKEILFEVHWMLSLPTTGTANPSLGHKKTHGKAQRRLSDEIIQENTQGRRFQEHPDSETSDLRPWLQEMVLERVREPRKSFLGISAAAEWNDGGLCIQGAAMCHLVGMGWRRRQGIVLQGDLTSSN